MRQLVATASIKSAHNVCNPSGVVPKTVHAELQFTSVTAKSVDALRSCGLCRRSSLIYLIFQPGRLFLHYISLSCLMLQKCPFGPALAGTLHGISIGLTTVGLSAHFQFPTCQRLFALRYIIIGPYSLLIELIDIGRAFKKQ